MWFPTKHLQCKQEFSIHELECERNEVEKNAEMKALKDAEDDQRYILDAKNTILHTYVYIHHTSPPPLNFTDICN